MTGKCGSVQVRLIPAPRGTGIVGAPVPKKLLQMAGIEDCYTSARGSTGTLGNFGQYIIHIALKGFETQWDKDRISHYQSNLCVWAVFSICSTDV